MIVYSYIQIGMSIICITSVFALKQYIVHMVLIPSLLSLCCSIKVILINRKEKHNDILTEKGDCLEEKHYNTFVPDEPTEPMNINIYISHSNEGISPMMNPSSQRDSQESVKPSPQRDAPYGENYKDPFDFEDE